jgi:YfiH family protein
VAVATLPDRRRGQPPRFDAFPATDAIVTDVPAVAPGVFVADCVPLLLYDPRQHALGVVHAGWRGTVALIAAAAVARMTEAFGTRPAELLAGIGPSIGPCCYEVGDEVIAAWRAADVERAEAAVSRPESYHFDLWMANRLALERAGVPRRRIEWSGRCVRCERERFFSYRAASQGLAAPGRMLLAAQLLPLD